LNLKVRRLIIGIVTLIPGLLMLHIGLRLMAAGILGAFLASLWLPLLIIGGFLTIFGIVMIGRAFVRKA